MDDDVKVIGRSLLGGWRERKKKKRRRKCVGTSGMGE